MRGRFVPHEDPLEMTDLIIAMRKELLEKSQISFPCNGSRINTNGNHNGHAVISAPRDEPDRHRAIDEYRGIFSTLVISRDWGFADSAIFDAWGDEGNLISHRNLRRGRL
jgi:hypothetical protein